MMHTAGVTEGEGLTDFFFFFSLDYLVWSKVAREPMNRQHGSGMAKTLHSRDSLLPVLMMQVAILERPA